MDSSISNQVRKPFPKVYVEKLNAVLDGDGTAAIVLYKLLSWHRKAAKDGKDWCARTYPQLGDDSGCSKDQVKRAVKKLTETFGFIEVKWAPAYGRPKMSHYRPTRGLEEALGLPVQSGESATPNLANPPANLANLPLQSGESAPQSGESATSYKEPLRTTKGTTHKPGVCAVDLQEHDPGEDPAPSGGGEVFGEEGPRPCGPVAVALDQADDRYSLGDLQEAWRSAHLEVGLSKVLSWRGPELGWAERLGTALAEVDLDPALVFADLVPGWKDFSRFVARERGWQDRRGPEHPDVEFAAQHAKYLVRWSGPEPDSDRPESDSDFHW